MRPQISRISQMKREDKNAFGLRLICVICEIRGSASDSLAAAERLLRTTIRQLLVVLRAFRNRPMTPTKRPR